MGYREEWFKNNKPIFGKYRCVRCGGLFPKSEIDIDHRIPKRNGGTDDLWNLQPMCKHCNRSKGRNNTKVETAVTMVGAAANGQIGDAIGGIAKQGLKDLLGIKYKRK